MTIRDALQTLIERRDLSRAEARAVMTEIMSGEATPAQIAGVLVGLRAKGETADEIAGCADAMREHVVPVHPTRAPVVDVVGTGGDGAGTFNISTTAALAAFGRSCGGKARQPCRELGLLELQTCSKRWVSRSSRRRTGSRNRSTSSASASCSPAPTILR